MLKCAREVDISGNFWYNAIRKDVKELAITKKMDDIGRIVIPQNLRRSLRWMGGDEIELVYNSDNETILLRKNEDNTAMKLKELSLDWQDDIDIQTQFNELISAIESKAGSN